MKLDIRQLARGMGVTEFDDPSLLDATNEEIEEVDIRRLRRLCRYSHHSHPAHHCRNR